MNEIIIGDCVEVMRAMPEASVDAIVTDPPYGLEFMGKEWDRLGITKGTPIPKPGHLGGFADGNKPSFERVRTHLPAMQTWHEAWAREAFRVLKPGGHLVAFGGTRTYHRLACALEDAGFEIRDCIMWLYGQGFPKSLDVSKAIDKAAGAERPIVAPPPYKRGRSQQKYSETRRTSYDYEPQPISAPATDAAREWSGWGTALKPAWEPIILARKPLDGTVAANVLKHGTGALNIDGSRIKATIGDNPTALRRSYGYTPNTEKAAESEAKGRLRDRSDPEKKAAPHPSDSLGRWPANVLLDEDAARLLDEQSGESQSRIGKPRGAAPGIGWGMTATGAEYADSGGASRFFYTSKAAGDERYSLCKTCDRVLSNDEHTYHDAQFKKAKAKHVLVSHPTVKPVDLMRWLVRLVTPPGGAVLDPFVGSGTTAVAARAEGMGFVAIEKDSDYGRIATSRLKGGELSFGK